jgi:D-alanine-D-alanine ligase
MKPIAVIFGGKSAEHDVSIITAHIPIIETLEASGQFDVWPVYISKEGRWYCDKVMNDLSFFKQPNWEAKVAAMRPVSLSLSDGFEISWPGFFAKRQKLDIVFPAMHGTYGEDGSLMGVLRMAHVPFVGCDIFASAVAMDKVLTKQVAAAEGLPVVPYVWFTRAQWLAQQKRYRDAIAKLTLPLFVKPVHLGSSIGITKVRTEKELDDAIEVALHYDDKVLVEESVENLVEITLPIMGNDEPRTAECERPLNKSELFGFEDKYLRGGKKMQQEGVNANYSEIPARIGEEMTTKIKELGKRVYTTLGCSGIARVDFLIDSKTSAVYVNEVNTLPGSLYHHNWKKAGVSNMDLVLSLVKLAEERFAGQNATTYSFKSDILNKVGGPKVQ